MHWQQRRLCRLYVLFLLSVLYLSSLRVVGAASGMPSLFDWSVVAFIRIFRRTSSFFVVQFRICFSLPLFQETRLYCK